MRGTNNLSKKYIFTQFEIVLNFHYFCKVRACWIPSKIQISKKCLKLWRNTSLMRGTNNFAKKYFFTHFEIVLNFHYFCKVRACRISVKNSDFWKVPKIVEKHFFEISDFHLPLLLMKGTNNFAKKYFLSIIWDSTKFSLFL